MIKFLIFKNVFIFDGWVDLKPARRQKARGFATLIETPNSRIEHLFKYIIVKILHMPEACMYVTSSFMFSGKTSGKNMISKKGGDNTYGINI